jgi:predicted Zn finger-like uncharacterized protein
MLITCRSCQARYTVADEKVAGKSLTVRCRVCEATILVDAHAVQVSAPVSPKPLSERPSPFDGPETHRRIPALETNSEASQMFTLAALVGRARASSAPPASTVPGNAKRESKRDGSGLIDLNALARAAEERARRAQSEPPPQAFARDPSHGDEPPPTIRHKAKYIGLAAAAAMIAAIGVFAVAGGGEDGTRAAGAAPTKVEAHKVIADARPMVGTAVAADDDAAPAPVKGKRGRRGAIASSGVKLTKVASGGTSSSQAAQAPPKPKPTAASDPCGCHGNLQCAIKCFK